MPRLRPDVGPASGLRAVDGRRGRARRGAGRPQRSSRHRSHQHDRPPRSRGPRPLPGGERAPRRARAPGPGHAHPAHRSRPAGGRARRRRPAHPLPARVGPGRASPRGRGSSSGPCSSTRRSACPAFAPRVSCRSSGRWPPSFPARGGPRSSSPWSRPPWSLLGRRLSSKVPVALLVVLAASALAGGLGLGAASGLPLVRDRALVPTGLAAGSVAVLRPIAPAAAAGAGVRNRAPGHAGARGDGPGRRGATGPAARDPRPGLGQPGRSLRGLVPRLGEPHPLGAPAPRGSAHAPRRRRRRRLHRADPALRRPPRRQHPPGEPRRRALRHRLPHGRPRRDEAAVARVGGDATAAGPHPRGDARAAPRVGRPARVRHRPRDPPGQHRRPPPAPPASRERTPRAGQRTGRPPTRWCSR